MVKFVTEDELQAESVEPDVFYAGDDVEAFGDRGKFQYYDGPNYGMILFSTGHAHNVPINRIRIYRA